MTQGRFEKAAAESETKTGRCAPPAYDVYVVDGRDDSRFWIKVGGAWPHADGKGFGVVLVAVPAGTAKLILRARGKRKQEAE